MNTEEHPWRDKDLLERLYHDEDLNQYEIADRLGCARNTITQWMAKFDIETETRGPQTTSEEILRDEEKLREAYTGNTTTELCEQLECGAGTLSRWMNEHGIETGVRQHSEIGVKETYGKGWNKSKRRRVRERDGYECQGCGMSQEAHQEAHNGESLHVHHIQKRKTFDSAAEANAIENLITLCRSCHRTWEKLSPLRPA